MDNFFNFPFKQNTESFVGMSNRQMVEREEAMERAESPAEEMAEKDEGGDPKLPNNPTPSEPGY